MPRRDNYLTIGQIALRSGLATSALRFYETRGLIKSVRTEGNQRRYHQSTLRRIAVVRVAQSLGLTLEEIAGALASLPDGRIPTKRDWEVLSTRWRAQLDERIERLQTMRDKLTGCIGCGCLSLQRCSLYNPGDRAAAFGSGPRFLLGDSPEVD